MRTKVIIDGLNNTQKFRAVINGVIIGDCQVKDLVGNRFGQREQRVAVWDALAQIAMRRRVGTTLINGYGTNRDGVDVQIDLI
jgi:hypothetical protein